MASIVSINHALFLLVNLILSCDQNFRHRINKTSQLTLSMVSLIKATPYITFIQHKDLPPSETKNRARDKAYLM
jgi:hypothetical protein